MSLCLREAYWLHVGIKLQQCLEFALKYFWKKEKQMCEKILFAKFWVNGDSLN